jgi:hypothetical protein
MEVMEMMENDWLCLESRCTLVGFWWFDRC